MKGNTVDDTISWLGVQTSSKKVKACVRSVFQEMVAESLLFLRDPRLQIACLPNCAGTGVWAYFPVHRRRLIARHVSLVRHSSPAGNSRERG